MSNTESQVIGIVENVLGEKLANPEGLLDNGILDSLKTMQAIEQIEDAFDIQIDPDDFTHENFNSIAGMQTMIGKYAG